MNITRKSAKVQPEKWARYKYNLTTPIGKDGARITGCEEHIQLSRRAAGEGMVLLENNGLLPLQDGTKVSLFGIGSLDYVKGGGGSGIVYSAYTRNIYEGILCKAPRFSVYEPVTQYYYEYAAAHLDEYDITPGNPLFPEIGCPDALIASASRESDVAVITINRFSAEAFDRSSEKGDFYLTDTEQTLIDKVTAAFSHTVVVLNVGGMIDVSWIKNNPNIDAALLAWQGGMEGGLAIADILCGDVNPSGKLTDTFAATFSDYPSADTFHESDDYVCYYEDIYVGYRYFETIPGAKDRVQYPFGYGLSYTTFEITTPEAALVGDNIEIRVAVKNTGTYAGKEVVQVYYSAPQGLLGKSALSLAAFQKSRLLQPGETEDMCLTFAVSDMASYDDLGKLKMSAFLLEKGEYRFFAGNNCRNLKEASYRYVVAEEYRVTKQLQQRCAPNAIDRRMLSDGSFEPLPAFPILQHDIPASSNPFAPVEAEKPAKLIEVATGKISLDQFVAQFTEEELCHFMDGTPSTGVANTGGMAGLSRLGIPAVMTTDGPAGVRLDPTTGIPTTAWPCATLLACTWNPDLATEIGKAGALEAKENGLAIWLTPGLNIHRNPLCGRNFEYFSEDPLLSGKFAAAKVRGIQSMGIAATIKHFACNNKETNRNYSDSRLSERALREIYFRGFEICIKESQPWILMTSYNIVNARRCCESYEQVTGVLREEWGYQGMVTSDWGAICHQPNCTLAGNDIFMSAGFPDHIREALHTGKLQRSHVEACAKRILEMILKLD